MVSTDVEPRVLAERLDVRDEELERLRKFLLRIPKQENEQDAESEPWKMRDDFKMIFDALSAGEEVSILKKGGTKTDSPTLFSSPSCNVTDNSGTYFEKLIIEIYPATTRLKPSPYYALSGIAHYAFNNGRELVLQREHSKSEYTGWYYEPTRIQ